MLTIEKRGRFWAVSDGEELVCVAVYKRGAAEVVRRLTQAQSEVTFERASGAGRNP